MGNNKKSILIILSFLIFLVLTFGMVIADDKPKDNLGKLKINHIFGEIQFNENIESYDDKTTLAGSTIFERNRIKVSHKDLKTKKAKITFKLSNIKNPILFRDGIWIKNAKIKKKDLTSWEVNVKHFSIYEIKENNFIGTFSNTTLSSGNLTLEQDAIFIADFENVENVADKSVYGNNIDDYTPSYTDQCKYGFDCSKFDGINDYLEIGHYLNSEPYYKYNNEVTICTWINISDASKINDLVGLGFYGSSLTWKLYENNFKMRMYIRDSGNNYHFADDTISAPENRWFSACGVRNLTHVGIYVDGVIKGSTPTTTTGFSDQNHELVIGGTGTNGYATPIGSSKASVQCLQIFESALTAENIIKINNSFECMEGSLFYDTIVDNYIINIGDDDGGNLTSLQTFSDGNVINIGELNTGISAYDVRFEFTGFSKGDLVKEVFLNVTYNGGSGHLVDLTVLDVNLGEFLPLEPIADTGLDYVLMNVTIPNFMNIIDNTGKITFGMNHTDPGNISHELYVDYISIELESPISSWNLTTGTKTILDHYGINDLDSGAYFNDTGAKGTIGSYEFDGIDDSLDFGINTELEMKTNQSHTFSYWANVKGNTASTINTIASDLSGNLGYWLYISNDGSVRYRFGDYTCTYAGGLNDNQWYHIVESYDNNVNEMKIYVDGNLKTTCTSDYGYKLEGVGSTRLGSENNGNNYFLNGSIDEFKLFNYTLTPSEITGLYNTNPLSKWKSSGTFINLTEAITANPQTQANVWKGIGFNSSDCTNIIFASAKVGDCDTIDSTTEYPLLQNNCNFNFLETATGDCIKWTVFLTSDTETTIHISGYNISVNMTYNPFNDNISIQNATATWESNIHCNMSFGLNDTDQGSTKVKIYSNGIFLEEQEFTGLTAGNSIKAVFTGGDTDWKKDDKVYCTYQSNVTGVLSFINQSENITIQNGDFSVTWKPNQNTTTAKPDTGRTFTATINDPDNDVNVSWYVNGVLTATGTSWKYLPSTSDVDSIFTIKGNASDGEYTYINEWEVTIEEVNMGLAMVAVMLFLGGLMIIFSLATWYFDNGLKFFFLLLTSLITLVGLNISATVAASVSEPIGNVLWVVYRVGLIIFMFLFFVVLIKLMGELKLRRNALNTDNLDSPGQNKSLLRGNKNE